MMAHIDGLEGNTLQAIGVTFVTDKKNAPPGSATTRAGAVEVFTVGLIQSTLVSLI